jgi:two-component system response regulator FixJ
MADETSVHVIDDDEAMRDSLAFLLQSANVPVRTHGSAVDFLAALPEVRSGCIVTDVRMPEIDGLELLRRLKKLGVHLPVIVITGHGDVPLAVEAMRIGAVDFLEKPFSDDVLLASVRAALANEHADGRRHAEKSDVVKRAATLSRRERQVLEGLVAGKPNLRPWHQPAHDRDLPRQRHGQDAGRKPFGPGPHGVVDESVRRSGAFRGRSQGLGTFTRCIVPAYDRGDARRGRPAGRPHAVLSKEGRVRTKGRRLRTRGRRALKPRRAILLVLAGHAFAPRRREGRAPADTGGLDRINVDALHHGAHQAGLVLDAVE